MAMTNASTNASTMPRLRRVLGQGGAAALSIGVMAPTLAMSVVGPEPARLIGRAAPLAFALAGLLVFLVSAGFVRLSAHFASAGSVYAFVGGSLGPCAGAFTGWAMLGTYLVFPWVSVAGITIFSGDLARLVGVDVDWYPLALAGWLVVGVLGAGGLRPAVRALIAFEAGAVLVILGLMAVVVGHCRRGGIRDQRSTFGVHPPGEVPVRRVVTAATPRSWPTAASRRPGRWVGGPLPLQTIPRAMLWTVGLGLAFYAVCVTVQVWGFGADPAGVAAFAGSVGALVRTGGNLRRAVVGGGARRRRLGQRRRRRAGLRDRGGADAVRARPRRLLPPSCPASRPGPGRRRSRSVSRWRSVSRRSPVSPRGRRSGADVLRCSATVGVVTDA